MIDRIREEWSIVLVGKWNVGIFSPEWLRANLLKDQKVNIEVGVEPGTPRKLTGDGVTVIPMPDRLVFLPTSLEPSTLARTEELARRLLELLPHTPVSQCGLNFAFRISPIPAVLEPVIADPMMARFSDAGVAIIERAFTWALAQEEGVLNLACTPRTDHLTVGFNYHFEVPSAAQAHEIMRGRMDRCRESAIELLDSVFSATDGAEDQ